MRGPDWDGLRHSSEVKESFETTTAIACRTEDERARLRKEAQGARPTKEVAVPLKATVGVIVNEWRRRVFRRRENKEGRKTEVNEP